MGEGHYFASLDISGEQVEQDKFLETKKFRFQKKPLVNSIGSDTLISICTQVEHWPLDARLPVVADVPKNLWGRDILEDMGIIFNKEDHAIFDNGIQHWPNGPCWLLTPVIEGPGQNPQLGNLNDSFYY